MQQTTMRRAPFINHQENTRGLQIDMLLSLIGIYIICFYYYGPRVVVLGVLSVFTAVVCDWLFLLFSRRRVYLTDFSPMITGLILPLLMPASIAFYVPVLAASFGIIVAKGAFGGTGHNVFNPAAAGFAFVSIAFSGQIFSYPVPNPQIPLPMFPGNDVPMTVSPASTLSANGIPAYEIGEMLLGAHAGPMGATNILVILACLLYLTFRRTVRWEVPVFFLLTASFLAFLFPRAPFSGVDSVMYEMMSGMILFGGVFMLGDPVTTPTRDWSKILYGILAAFIAMLFRHMGRFEEGFIYALLIMNATVWGFDMAGERAAAKIRRQKRLKADKSTDVRRPKDSPNKSKSRKTPKDSNPKDISSQSKDQQPPKDSKPKDGRSKDQALPENEQPKDNQAQTNDPKSPEDNQTQSSAQPGDIQSKKRKKSKKKRK